MLIIQQAEAKIILLAQPLFRLAIYRSGVQVAESLMLCPCVSDASLPFVDQAEIPWPAMLTLPAPHSSAGWPWQPSPAQPSPTAETESEVQSAAPFKLATNNKQPEKECAGPRYLRCCFCLLFIISIRHDSVSSRLRSAHTPWFGFC